MNNKIATIPRLMIPSKNYNDYISAKCINNSQTLSIPPLLPHNSSHDDEKNNREKQIINQLSANHKILLSLFEFTRRINYEKINFQKEVIEEIRIPREFTLAREIRQNMLENYKILQALRPRLSTFDYPRELYDKEKLSYDACKENGKILMLRIRRTKHELYIALLQKHKNLGCPILELPNLCNNEFRKHVDTDYDHLEFTNTVLQIETKNCNVDDNIYLKFIKNEIEKYTYSDEEFINYVNFNSANCADETIRELLKIDYFARYLQRAEKENKELSYKFRNEININNRKLFLELLPFAQLEKYYNIYTETSRNIRLARFLDAEIHRYLLIFDPYYYKTETYKSAEQNKNSRDYVPDSIDYHFPYIKKIVETSPENRFICREIKKQSHIDGEKINFYDRRKTNTKIILSIIIIVSLIVFPIYCHSLVTSERINYNKILGVCIANKISYCSYENRNGSYNVCEAFGNVQGRDESRDITDLFVGSEYKKPLQDALSVKCYYYKNHITKNKDFFAMPALAFLIFMSITLAGVLVLSIHLGIGIYKDKKMIILLNAQVENNTA